MLLLLVGVYIGLVLYAHFFAESMIFLPPRHRYKDSEPRFAGQLVKLKTSQQETIAAVHLRDPDAKYTLLISHGNAEDIAGLLPMLKEIRGWGYNILAYDYPGYGASSGRPTEAGSYRAIDAAYAYLVEDQKVPAERIIALGRSLGGAMAIDLA